MGLLVDGKWVDQWYDTASSGGRFERKSSAFRGAPEAIEAGRYHLYVSYACPWAHRALIVRALLGLEQAVGVSAVEPLMLEHGWTFAPDGDSLYSARFLYELYQRAKPSYTGRVTVPVLWDKQRETIVNNESSEIIVLLNDAFRPLATRPADLYPSALRAEIDAVNERVYATLNNGVYRCGFATTQDAYEEAFTPLFATLDWLDERLAARRWLMGDAFTLADVRLFTTLIRFDAVYFGHFKCNQQRVEDYPNLRGYLRDIYQLPGVAATVNMEHIKRHYYGSHKTINPSGVIPLGPRLDFSTPPGRERLAGEAQVSG